MEVVAPWMVPSIYDENALDEVRARAGEVKVVAEHLWRHEL
jgi:hypothetical protein